MQVEAVLIIFGTKVKLNNSIARFIVYKSIFLKIQRELNRTGFLTKIIPTLYRDREHFY